jgi:2,4-dienoyl-CoA reductase-like NADH-dependent reductase (Old Yellow Enzyme family)
MSILLAPTKVANMELSNRFVRSATYDGLSTEQGEITDGSVAVVRDLAKGGVGLVGGLRSFDLMEEIVGQRVADCVSLCRPFIREPGLVAEFRGGRAEPARCISCNGCLKGIREGRLGCIFED